jgi:hypothetical protein
MKKHTFKIELEFDSEIVSDDAIHEVMVNILESLENTVNTSNLVPLYSDNYTKIISVSNDFIQSKIEKEIV